MRPAIGERLHRLLAMLAYLAEVGWADYDELAERFDLPVERLRSELMLAAMCGVPPYDGASLIELILTDHGVSAVVPGYLHRPPRLDRREGFAVLAAGEALRSAGGDGIPDGALHRALDKLGAALGMDHEDVRIDVDHPPWLDEVRRAVDERRVLALRYYTAWRDEVGDRLVDPLLVHLTDGRWYLEACDHGNDEVRKFRLDRIEEARVLEETFVPGDLPDEVSNYVPGLAARTVRLWLPADARWVLETYPVTDVVEHPDGTTEAQFSVVGTAWLERLLLRVGPGAEVLEPAELADLGRDAATRLLALYR